jgi:hypothetical protein
MKPKNFLKAIEIMTENHTNEIIINKSTGHGSTTGDEKNPTLHIVHCTASTINKLMGAGFSLSMNKGFLSVADYSVN